jgi:hypothetical protein
MAHTHRNSTPEILQSFNSALPSLNVPPLCVQRVRTELVRSLCGRIRFQCCLTYAGLGFRRGSTGFRFGRGCQGDTRTSFGEVDAMGMRFGVSLASLVS